MHGGAHDLISLLVLLVGSVLMPIVAGRVHVPSAILLIVYGFLVGPSVGRLVAADGVVPFLAQVGLMVLMFLAGLEIDFNRIRERGPRAMVRLVTICFLVFALAFSAAWSLAMPPIMGLCLGAMSLGLPLAVLNETGRLKTTLGQTVILLGSVGEFLTVIGMTLFALGVRFGLHLGLLVGLGKLALVTLGMALALRVLMAVAWWHPLTFSRLVERHDGAEIGVRASLLLMLVFSLAALFAGVEAIVGAFVAGSIVSFVFRGKEVLERKLSAVGHGLFIPIFFTVVGVRFAPWAISRESLLLAGQMLVIAALIKVAPAHLLIGQGLSWRQAASVGALLAAPLTLIVAIASLGVELGILDSSQEAALIVLAAASGLLFPVGFRFLAGPGGEAREH
jgi:Kef-type K+ transport system membrane component KefB